MLLAVCFQMNLSFSSPHEQQSRHRTGPIPDHLDQPHDPSFRPLGYTQHQPDAMRQIYARHYLVPSLLTASSRGVLVPPCLVCDMRSYIRDCSSSADRVSDGGNGVNIITPPGMRYLSHVMRAQKSFFGI